MQWDLGVISSAIDARRQELVELTCDLVRFPTVNPPGEAYVPCAEYIGNWLKSRRFDILYERAHDTPGDSDKYPRTNVIGRREGTKPGPTVHFNSHIDVVEAGHGWTHPPFEPVIEGDRIIGRGTCDMKGGLAASMIAVDTFLALCPEFAGAIEISGTVDEESGGFGGVAWLAERGYFSKPRVDHVIIPEPLHKDRICLGHRGVWWAQVETKGEIAHGSMPFLGDCAVRHMGAVISKFEDELFPSLAKKHTAMPVIPEGARQSTLNINSIHGGQQETRHIGQGNTEQEQSAGLPSPNVPDSCRMVIDRRFLIEEDLEEVKLEVVSILEGLKNSRDRFDYQLTDLMEVLPSMTDADQPVVIAVGKAIEQVLGHPAQHVVSPGSYDQKHINRIGHLHDCIAYGPGILDQAHRPDEFISITDMLDSAKVMANALHFLLHGK